MVVRIFLLDDHEMVRLGIRDLISPHEDLSVVGEAAGAEEALRLMPQIQPDVAILDVRLRDDPSAVSGIEVCREIRSAHPEVACLMLSSFADDEAKLASLMAGAAGYVLKDIHGDDLVNAIRRVAAGERLLSGAVTDRVLRRVRSYSGDEDPLGTLTPQERRILDLVAEGMTNRQIGDSLALAEKTVKNYVSNVLTKLGLERRTQAAVLVAAIAKRSAPTD